MASDIGTNGVFIIGKAQAWHLEITHQLAIRNNLCTSLVMIDLAI